MADTDTDADTGPGDRPPEDGTSRVVRLPGADGLSLAADVGGPPDGPTVVLLHGGGQTRHSWAGTWRKLAEAGWRAWSVDMRGHGDSDWAPDGDYSLDAFADDVRALAGAMPRPPVLVGASLGGLSSMVALVDSGRQERLARALVLVDVAHRIEESGQERIGAFMTGNLDGFASLEEASDAIAAYNPHRPRPKDLSGLAKNLRRRDDGRWVWHWDPAFVGGKFEPDRAGSPASADPPGRTKGSPDETRSSVVDADRLGRAVDGLRLPTLLVRGRSSDLLSEEGARDFLARAPHAEFADVAGAGHMVAGDRNEVFNRAILTFLARHRP